MTAKQAPQVRAPSVKKALLTGAGVLVMFFFLAPYIQMLITSLTPAKELYDVPAQYLPSRFELSNFVEVWTAAPLWGYLRSSLIIAGFATLLVLVVALPAAYYTARYRYRGRLLFLLQRPRSKSHLVGARIALAGVEHLPQVEIAVDPDTFAADLHLAQPPQQGIHPR